MSRFPSSPRLLPRVILAALLLAPLAACKDSTKPAETPTATLEVPEPIEALIADLGRLTEDEQAFDALLARIGRKGRQEPDVVMPALIEALGAESRDPFTHRFEFVVDFSQSDIAPAERGAALTQVRNILLARCAAYHPAAQPRLDVNSADRKTGRATITLRVAKDPRMDANARARFEETLLRRLGRRGAASLHLVAQEGEAVEALRAREPESSDEAPIDGEGLRSVAVAPAADQVYLDAPSTGRLVVRTDADGMLRGPRFRLDGLERRDAAGRAWVGLTFRWARGEAEAARAWLAKHPGATAALVVDGRVRYTTKLPAEGEPAEAFENQRLAPVEDRDAVQRIARLVAYVRPGEIKVPLTAEVGDSAPQILDTPVAKAIIAVGGKAEPYLADVSFENPNYEERLLYVREQVTRFLTGQGDRTAPNYRDGSTRGREEDR